MKKSLIAISALLLSLSLNGCQNGSSVAETSSAAESSAASEVSSSVTPSSSIDKDACVTALNGEHKFPSYSINSLVTSNGENLLTTSSKKEIDLTNNIEHIISYESKVQSIDGGNASTVVTNTDIYKTSSSTYTLGDNGLYTVTNSSDAVFKKYTTSFAFSSVTSWALTTQGYTRVLTATISNIPSFTASTSYADAKDMVVVASLSTENVLTGIKITYTYKDSYSVSLTYAFSYLDVELTLPTV